MSSVSVLDASAILAVILSEVGADKVLSLGKNVAASTVNISEVRSKLFDKGHGREMIEAALHGFGIREVAFDSAHAEIAADLRLVSREAGLSFADRACLALAQSFGAIAVTADRNWTRVNLPVQVEVIR